MTFKEYWHLNRLTIRHGFKISGVIFTSVIFLFIVGAFFTKGYEIHPIKTFLLCFVPGNLFGAFIIFLAAGAGHRGAKKILSFYGTIPAGTKEKYGLEVVNIPENPLYNFMRFIIVSKSSENENIEEKENPQFLFDRMDDKSVRIMLPLDVSEVNNFFKYSRDLEKKYPKQQISLNGYGIVKTISPKIWKVITDEDIDGITVQLIDIAVEEGFLNGEKVDNADLIEKSLH